MEETEQATATSLVEAEKYLKSGAHIGTRFKSGEMRKYIYKIRKDGLNVLDVQTLDERVKIAANFLAQFNPEKVVIISRKLYGQTPAKVFAKTIGGKAYTGRFVPGTFTNPEGKEFIEPEVIIAVEPEPDVQAVNEAAMVNVPVVALCSTNNSLRNIDLAIPVNNKGRKSIALVFWLLAREILKIQGKIKSDAEFTVTVEDFEYKMKEGEKEFFEEERPAFRERRPRPDKRRRK
jgi:small subunit ribosomal protein S2